MLPNPVPHSVGTAYIYRPVILVERVNAPLGQISEAILDGTPIASDYLQESRTGRNIRHHLVPLLRQSIYSRLAGYDDTNDAERPMQNVFPKTQP